MCRAIPSRKAQTNNRMVFGRPVLTAFACCVVPVLTVIICTTWSMGTGLIQPCMPFVDGCTSISRACRQIPVIYLFRTLMLPCSLLLFLFWWQERSRLESRCPERTRLRQLSTGLALVGAVFLVPYVVFLGTSGPVYDFLRRIGIYFFFAGTGVAQAIITLGIERGKTGRCEQRLRQIRHCLVVMMLFLGPLNLLLKSILIDPDAAENIIEWWFALALFLWFGAMSATRWNSNRILST